MAKKATGSYLTSQDENADMKLLQRALEKGIIDTEHVADMLDMIGRKELLEKYHIWQGRNGYWYARLPVDGGTKLTRSKNRKDLEDKIVAFERTRSETFGQAFSRWNDTRAELGFIAEATRDVNGDLFRRYLGELGEKDVSSLTPSGIAKYLERIVGTEHMTAKAFSNVKGLVLGTVKSARRDGLIAFAPDDVVRELDVPERAFRKIQRSDGEESFSDEEMRRITGYLMEHTDNVRNLAVLTLTVTGLRIGELVALRWEDVGNGYLSVRATETRRKDSSGKWVFSVKESAKTAAGERNVPIPRDFCWIWDAIRSATGNESGFVFVNERGERLNAQSVRAHLRRLCDRLGMPRRSPHRIRKTYCTMLFENGVDPKVIEKIMGHVDISISERFYHKDRSSIDEKIDIVSRVISEQN